MSVADVIALGVCTLSLITAIVASAIWVCSKLEKLAVAVAGTVTHEQCSLKRDSCPCIREIQEINELIEKKHPRI